jgi:cation-transporting ATPase F
MDLVGVAVTGQASEAQRLSLIAGPGCNDAVVLSKDGRWKLVGGIDEGGMLAAVAKVGTDPK